MKRMVGGLCVTALALHVCGALAARPGAEAGGTTTAPASSQPTDRQVYRFQTTRNPEPPRQPAGPITVTAPPGTVAPRAVTPSST